MPSLGRQGHGQRNAGIDDDAACCSRDDFDLSAKLAHALADAEETEPAALLAGNSAPIVPDDDAKDLHAASLVSLLLAAHAHLRHRRMGMARDVGQALLDD